MLAGRMRSNLSLRGRWGGRSALSRMSFLLSIDSTSSFTGRSSSSPGRSKRGQVADSVRLQLLTLKFLLDPRIVVARAIHHRRHRCATIERHEKRDNGGALTHAPAPDQNRVQLLTTNAADRPAGDRRDVTI